MTERNLQGKERSFPDILQLFILIILFAVLTMLWRSTPDAFGADVYVDASGTGFEDVSEACPNRSLMEAINDSIWGEIVRIAPGSATKTW